MPNLPTFRKCSWILVKNLALRGSRARALELERTLYSLFSYCPISIPKYLEIKVAGVSFVECSSQSLCFNLKLMFLSIYFLEKSVEFKNYWYSQMIFSS